MDIRSDKATTQERKRDTARRDRWVIKLDQGGVASVTFVPNARL